MINLRDLKQFSENQYTRHLVFKSGNMEVIVVCWMPGQGSPRHGHGPSDVVEVVLEGKMAFTNYYPDGKKVSGVCYAGDITNTPEGVEHEIANGCTTEPLVTMHIYSPPLNPEFQGFDLGYNNEVALEEIQLPQDQVIRLLRACSPQKNEDPNYVI